VVLTAAGEPLINNFDEIAALARHYQVKMDMFTSCFNMTEERFRASRELFDLLHVQRLFKTHEGLENEDILTAMPRAELDAIIAETTAEAKRLNQTVILHEIGYPNVYADPQPRSENPPLMTYREHGVCWFAGPVPGTAVGAMGITRRIVYPPVDRHADWIENTPFEIVEGRLPSHGELPTGTNLF
jgi:hypothetical protein